LRAVLRDYRGWIDAQGKVDMDLIKSRLQTTPFFDGAAAAQIRSDIYRKLAGGAPPKSSGDPLFRARIFLHLAQDFDWQQEEIHRQLRCIDQLNERLQAHLAAAEDIPGQPMGAGREREANGSADFLMRERLRAWSRLFLAAPTPSPLFITTNRTVFEDLREGFPDSCVVFRQALLTPTPDSAARQDTANRSWDRYVAELKAAPCQGPPDKVLADDTPGTGGHPSRLSLCRLSRTPPSAFWQAVAERGFAGGVQRIGADTEQMYLGLFEQL
jgi:hypothetical protein